MKAIRQCVLDMTGYIPGESADDPAVIKLNQNENRYPPSQAVCDAISGATGAGLASYPDSTSQALRRAAANVYRVQEDEVMATNGSDEMLRILFQACCDPGDEVVAFYPSYTYYATLAAMHDTRYKLIDFEGHYHLPDRLDVEAAKLVFLPNPNAPTGTVFPEQDVRRLIEAVPNGVVVMDEAYADFCDYTAIPLIKEYDNVFVVRTFSKSYSLAGLRVGLGFARQDFLTQLEKIRDFYNLDRLAQAGAEAALRDQAWLESTVARVRATRSRVQKGLAAMGLTVYDSGANFLLVRFRDDLIAQRVFREFHGRGILVRYFRNRGISDCLRVSIGTDDDMDAFLRHMEDIVRIF